MLPIDPRTIILLSGVMGGLMSLVMYFLRRNYPAKIKGLREWASAMLLLFLAGVIGSMRNIIPDVLAIAAANALLLSGSYGLLLGSQCFYERTPTVRAHVALIAVLSLILLWFTVGNPHPVVRLLLVNAALCYLFGKHLRLMLHQSKGAFSSRFVIAVLWLATLSQIFRFYTAVSMPSGLGLLDTLPQNLAYITLYPFIMLLLAIGLVLLATDRLRGELEHLATHDSLTNALTRRHMSEACDRELERCRRHGRSMALLAMDLDHFKTINDTYGHQAGDRVLIGFVDSVNALLRRPDQLGRFGGEEFVVLLPDTSQAEAQQVAERIRAACSADTDLPACTVSIGVAWSGDANDTQDSLLGRADAALYRAKAKGRNRVELQDAPATEAPSLAPA